MEENLKIECAQEEDGRWIADAVDLPGVMAYGLTREEARAKVEDLARQILQDQSPET